MASHLQLLSLSVEGVANYNANGASLAAALLQSELDTLHYPLILGMFAVYSILVVMGDIAASEVVWPPHTNKQVFDPEKWLEAKFHPAVVAILALLPYPKDGVEYSIAPEAQGLSYLGDLGGNGGPGYEDLRNGEGFHVGQRCFDFVGTKEQLIQLNHIRLTDGGGGGDNYIYDTEEGLIMINSMWARRGDNMNLYESATPFFPATEVMHNWVHSLNDLIYNPWPYEMRGLRVHPGGFEYDASNGARLPTATNHSLITQFCNDPLWHTETMYPKDMRRVDANVVRSLRIIFRAHGWPDNFDKAACWVALDKWEKERDSLESALDKARLGLQPWEYGPQEDETRKALDLFCQRSAGQLAVVFDFGEGRAEL